MVVVMKLLAETVGSHARPETFAFTADDCFLRNAHSNISSYFYGRRTSRVASLSLLRPCGHSPFFAHITFCETLFSLF